MGKQKEFDGMPEQSELGKKALEVVVLREQISDIDKRIEVLRGELVELFIKTGKTSIRVEGHLVSYAHVENDKIIIKHQAKDKEAE